MKMLCTKKKCRDKDKNGFCKHYEELICRGLKLYCEYGVEVENVHNTPEFRKPVPPPPPTTGSNAYKPPRCFDILTVQFPRDSFLKKKIEREKAAFEQDIVKEIYTEGRWEKVNPNFKPPASVKKPETAPGEYTATLLLGIIENYCKKFEKIIITQIENDTIKIKFENKRNKK